jgi:hypothetical protein
MNYNNLLILERSSSTLTSKTLDGSYVLEGIFGEIDKKNKNNRIYTEAEYVPQIEALQEKIKSSKLLGELDHPAKFDISLKNVSHIIEELTYDKETKQVRGKIRLLDTDAGKQAKALVDAGVPLQISSRAAGAVESNGQVKIKQLFTYDLVADPGFENAELNRINESFGLSNDSNIQIFKITEDLVIDETKTIQNNNNEQELMENKARFVSVEDFNKYSEYLSEEIKTLKNALAGTSTDNIEEKLNTLTSYVEYVAERADKSIQYTEYLAENLDKNIDYSNYVAEKLDESISYTEHIAESANKIKEYSNYLAESMNEGAVDYENVTKYLNYLKENVESVSEYTDYIAETINANLIVEDTAGIEAEDIKADTKEINSEDDKGITKVADVKVPTEADAITEKDSKVNENPALIALAAAELLKKKEEEARPEDEDDEVNAEKDEVEKDELEEATVNENPALIALAAAELLKKKKESTDTEDEEDTIEVEVEETVSAIDAYKNEISEKLSLLINKSIVKKNNNPHFFRLVSEATQNKFNELEEADKSKVLASVEGRGYLTEGQINTLMESALIEVAGQTAPYFVEAMPSEYRDTWTALSETKKFQISAQARMVKLTSPYQVKNFWDTRDLRETTTVMEKVEMIKESKVAEAPKSTLTYSVEGIGEALAKRFKK